MTNASRRGRPADRGHVVEAEREGAARFAMRRIDQPHLAAVGQQPDGDADMAQQAVELGGRRIVPKAGVGFGLISLLHKSSLWPRRGERAHVLEIARREALHVGECLAQIRGQPVNHLGPPPLVHLPLQDHLANIPVERNHRCVGGKNDPQAFFLDALLDSAESVRILLRQACLRGGRRKASLLRLLAPGEPVLQFVALTLTSHTRDSFEPMLSRRYKGSALARTAGTRRYRTWYHRS